MNLFRVRLLSALGLLLGSLLSLFGFLYYPPAQCFGYYGEASCPTPFWYYVLDYGSAAIALVSMVTLLYSLLKRETTEGGTQPKPPIPRGET